MADPTGPRPSTAQPAVGAQQAAGGPPPSPPYNYKVVLQQAVQMGASDLHLKVGRAPMARLNGELSPLELPPLTPADDST